MNLRKTNQLKEISRKTNQLKAELGITKFEGIHNIFEMAVRSYPLHKNFLARSYPEYKNFVDLSDKDLADLATSEEYKVRSAFRFLKTIVDIKQPKKPEQTTLPKSPVEIAMELSSITQDAYMTTDEITKSTIALILLEFQRVDKSEVMDKTIMRQIEGFYRRLAHDIDAKSFSEANFFVFTKQQSPSVKRKKAVTDSPAMELNVAITPTVSPEASPEMQRLSQTKSTDIPVGTVRVLEKQISKSSLFSKQTEVSQSSQTEEVLGNSL